MKTAKKLVLGAAVAGYAATVPLANFLITEYGPVPAGFGLMAPAGVYVAGAAFLLRDVVHRTGGAAWALGAVTAGTALSAIVGDPRLALASSAAFATAQLVDTGVFAALRERLLLAVVLSNVIGLLVDTLVFLPLAFGDLTFFTGQVIGKAWMTVVAVAVMLAWKRHAR